MIRRIHRRLGRPEPLDAPSIPGMQVVDWRIVELETSNVTVVLCHRDSALYVALLHDRSPPDLSQLTELSSVAEIETVLRLDALHLADIYPAFTAQYTLYLQKPCKKKKKVFVKHAKILDLIAATGMSVIRTLHASEITAHAGEFTAHEASICDLLAFQQHANIAEFLGVQVQDKLEFDFEGRKIAVPLGRNSFVGLVFTKYDCTLREMMDRPQKLNVKLCLQSVSAGIQYLHDLGFVHGDIRPDKIYVKRGYKDHFVIGDFGSAHETGSVITFKTGDPLWSRPKIVGVDTAEEYDDWAAFRKLIAYLVGKTGGKIEDYKEIQQERQSCTCNR
ncbi:hypothetical protein OPT61_g2956 [Boeremia exigua]|uniref:Uncharacterized protein n=1 Tax=Boeremia exigua TaxID=749465 RepID=A0ACC2IJN7_9PLEO|nr:hypothetical protein OPT61_g2956 [Boeremia exigua]